VGARLKAFVTVQVYRDKLEQMKGLLGAADATEVAVRLGNSIEAFNSVPAAICCFLRHPGSFEEAVVEAVSLGGDADTIASMTGAISGAWLRIEAIPDEWAAIKPEKGLYLCATQVPGGNSGAGT